MFTCTCDADEFIASIPADLDPDHIGIIVYADGTVSNRWGDGTAGVDEWRRYFAADDTTPYCPRCGELAHWVTPLRYVGRL